MKILPIIKASILLLFFYSGVTFGIQVPGPLIDTNWLDKHQAEVVIIDVRKDKKSFTAKAKKGNKIAGMQGCGAKKGSGIKVAGHIPGAIFFNWKKVRAKRNVDGFDLIKLVPTNQKWNH